MPGDGGGSGERKRLWVYGHSKQLLSQTSECHAHSELLQVAGDSISVRGFGAHESLRTLSVRGFCYLSDLEILLLPP